MKPGREMDAIVAEKVMQWDGTFGVVSFAPDEGFSTDDIETLVKKGHLKFDPPKYSTDIAAAFEVRNKMRLLACGPDGNRPREFVEKYHIGFAKHLRYIIEGECDHGIGDSIAFLIEPHHICLAALKAVGVEV